MAAPVAAPPAPVTPPAPEPAPAAEEPTPDEGSDVGNRTMLFDDVMKIPPPKASSRPNLNALANSMETSGERAAPPPPEEPPAPAPAPAPAAPAAEAPKPLDKASVLAAVNDMAPPEPAQFDPAGNDGDEDDIGGRTMAFGSVITIPPPPAPGAPGAPGAPAADGTPAAPGAPGAPATQDEPADEEFVRRSEGDDGNSGAIKVLVILGLVIVLVGAVFAAGFAVRDAVARKQLDDAIARARNELEHGNPAGALLLLDTIAANAVNAEAQQIRARAAILTKKAGIAQSAVQTGLKDKNASARDRANLQSLEGEINLSQGNAQEAVRALREACDADPKNPNAHRLLGEAFAKLEQWSDAKRELDAALSLDPALPRARLLRVRVELRLGDRVAANNDLDALSAQQDLELRLVRGDLRLRDGDVAAAIDDATNAIKAAQEGKDVPPGWLEQAQLLHAHALILMGDAPAALALIEEVKKGGNVPEPELERARTRAIAVAGRFDEAARIAADWKPLTGATEGAAASDAAERAFFFLEADRMGDASNAVSQAPAPPSIAFYAVGRLALAKVACDLARGKDAGLSSAETAVSTLADARSLLGGPPILIVDGVAVASKDLEARAAILAGRVALRAGEEPKAQAFLDKAVQAAPKSPLPLLARASERLRKGDVSRAIIDLDAALDVAPNDANALRQRASIALAANEVEKALGYLEKAAQGGARDPFLHFDRCRGELQRGQADAAYAALERAHELGLPAIVYADGRAKIALAKVDHEAAEHWLSKLIAERPYDIDALEARARTRVARGVLADAVQDYLTLTALAPRIDYERALARLYIDQKKADLATTLLKGALTRSPKDPQLRALNGKLALLEGRYKDGVRELRTALSIDENLGWATLELALALVYACEDGIEFQIRRAREIVPESDPDTKILAACEDLITKDTSAAFSAYRAAKAFTDVDAKNHRAFAIQLRASEVRKDWTSLLDASNRCLASFPNDADALAAKKLAQKNGAREVAPGRDLPPPVQPVKNKSP